LSVAEREIIHKLALISKIEVRASKIAIVYPPSSSILVTVLLVGIVVDTRHYELIEAPSDQDCLGIPLFVLDNAATLSVA
jgi:hypothetical protein